MKTRTILLLLLLLVPVMAIAVTAFTPITTLWTRIENAIYTGYRVGIGTANPKAPLHVVGGAIINGTLYADNIVVSRVNLGNYSSLLANYYTKQEVDNIVLGNYTSLRNWVLANYYTRTTTDQLIQGNITDLRNWVIANYYTRTSVDQFILGNYTSLKEWILANYYDRSTTDNLILGNYTSLKNWVLVNYYDRSTVDSLILGNRTEIENWVQANYYDRSTIDSWNLIKGYTLQQDLNANGYNIWGINDIHMSGGPDQIAGIYGPNDASQIVLDNTERITVKGSLHVEPTPTGAGGNLVVTGNVGIGTSTPSYKLDVDGDARVQGHLYAEYIHITESGGDTGWYVDYSPDNGRVSLVKSGYGEVITVNPNRWINVSGWLKVEPWSGSLTSPPSGWTMGIWTFDVYAEGTIAAGRNGEVKAYINSAGVVKGSEVRGGVVYADYYRLTEAGCWGSVTGTCSGWEIDYYPEGTMVFRYTNDGGSTYREVIKLWTFGVAAPFAIDKTFLSRVDSVTLDLVSVAPSSTGTILDLQWTGTVIVTIYSDDWDKVGSITITIDGVSKTMPFSTKTSRGTITLTFTVASNLKIEVQNTNTGDYAYFNVMIVKVTS